MSKPDRSGLRGPWAQAEPAEPDVNLLCKAAQLVEDEIRSIAQVYGFTLTVSLMRGRSVNTLHWMFDYRGQRVINYYPGNGTVWDPISRLKYKVDGPAEALICAMKSAGVDVPVCLRDVKG